MNVSQHDYEMRAHGQQIAEHEAGGKGENHHKLAKEHKQMQKHHEELAKLVEQLSDHHGELMDQINELGKKHEHKK